MCGGQQGVLRPDLCVYLTALVLCKSHSVLSAPLILPVAEPVGIGVQAAPSTYLLRKAAGEMVHLGADVIVSEKIPGWQAGDYSENIF